MWHRYLASFVDDVFVGLVVGAILVVALLVDTGVSFVVAVVLGVIFGVGYETVFIARRGQTPGKKALRLRVVMFYGGDGPGVGAALVRSIVKFLVGIPFSWVLYILIAFSLNGRGPHDVVAGTIVVRDE